MGIRHAAVDVPFILARIPIRSTARRYRRSRRRSCRWRVYHYPHRANSSPSSRAGAWSRARSRWRWRCSASPRTARRIAGIVPRRTIPKRTGALKLLRSIRIRGDTAIGGGRVLDPSAKTRRAHKHGLFSDFEPYLSEPCRHESLSYATADAGEAGVVVTPPFASGCFSMEGIVSGGGELIAHTPIPKRANAVSSATIAGSHRSNTK